MRGGCEIPGVFDVEDQFNTTGAPTDILYDPEWEEAVCSGSEVATTTARCGGTYESKPSVKSTIAA